MGVHFWPGGAFPFLGMSAYELEDTHLDLATLWGRQAGEIRKRLALAPSTQDRFRVLEDALRSRRHDPLEHDPAVLLALDGFHSDHSTRPPLARWFGDESGGIVVQTHR